MSQKIIDQARILGEMISESEELIKLRDAEAKLANDPVAQELIAQLNALHNKTMVAKQEGTELTAEEEAEYEAVEKQVENNATLSYFLEAQDSFTSLLDSINYLIMKGINGDADACETGCSTCGGGCGH